MKEKELLIDAIAGAGFFYVRDFAIKMQACGFARFAGNQWGENWEWDKRALQTLTVGELMRLRQLQKSHKDEE